jgi:hypothetical protein
MEAEYEGEIESESDHKVRGSIGGSEIALVEDMRYARYAR